MRSEPLGIGVKTVETHVRRIHERFGLAFRAELAARAMRDGRLEAAIPDTH